MAKMRGDWRAGHSWARWRSCFHGIPAVQEYSLWIVIRGILLNKRVACLYGARAAAVQPDSVGEQTGYLIPPLMLPPSVEDREAGAVGGIWVVLGWAGRKKRKGFELGPDPWEQTRIDIVLLVRGRTPREEEEEGDEEDVTIMTSEVMKP